MTQSKSIKWQEIKDYVSQLTGEQLKQDVYLMGDDRGFRVQAVGGLGDHYYQTDEGLELVSHFDPSDENDKLSNYKIIKPDDPFLHTDMYEND